MRATVAPRGPRKAPAKPMKSARLSTMTPGATAIDCIICTLAPKPKARPSSTCRRRRDSPSLCTLP